MNGTLAKALGALLIATLLILGLGCWLSRPASAEGSQGLPSGYILGGLASTTSS